MTKEMAGSAWEREERKERRASLEDRGLKVRGEKAEKEAEEEVTEIDAEHENGLCHPLSNTEPEDKGSVSASERESCFFQHLLDDNSYLSPHQKEERGESTEHTVLHVSSSSFASHLRPPQSRFLFHPPPPSSLPLSLIPQMHKYS